MNTKMKDLAQRLLGFWMLIELLLLTIVLSFGFIAWVFQLETNYSFIEMLGRVYIYGNIGSLIAWKGHILLLVISIFMGLSQNDK